MKEIGGYLQLDDLRNTPYYSEMKELNSGRNALAYLVKSRNIEKIYLPEFLCESVSGVLGKHGVRYETYRVNENFQIDFDKEIYKNEYLYVVNYYGQLTDEYLESIIEEYKEVIIDNTQAFFQGPLEGVDTIYSLRKYFGLPDGAYLFTNTELAIPLEEEKTSNRLSHIFGRYEGKASDYYTDFKKNDGTFEKSELKKISKISHNLLGALDYKKIKTTRENNFKYLHNNLKDQNPIKLIIPIGPFAYPFYVENGAEIRTQLAKKEIYIATLWPNVVKDSKKGTIEYNLATNILPIPCDQRYDLQDMERILKELRECIN